MIDPAGYLEERIKGKKGQIEWYDGKSGENKRWYFRLRVLSIIISLSIPILTNLIGRKGYDDIPLIIAIAGALVAFLEGVMSLKKYHEIWTTYRSTSEGLKYHLYLFETGATPYDAPNAFQLFVQNAESLMATERSKWIQISSQQDALPKASDYMPGDQGPAGISTRQTTTTSSTETIEKTVQPGEAPSEATKPGADAPPATGTPASSVKEEGGEEAAGDDEDDDNKKGE